MYYILASSGFNSITSKTVDLDSPGNYPSLTILTIEDPSHPNAGLGSSFADMPNLFGDGLDNIAVGEPNASLNGKTNNGGVFVFPVDTLSLSLGAANVLDVGSASSFVFAGANSGDQAGFSVANAGDVNGLTSPATTAVNDILIGAPGFNNNAGAAYLVYGGSVLTGGVLSTFPTGIDLSRLSIVPISPTDLTPPQDAVFVGAGSDRAGTTVSGAGDFNGDGLGDFMIGAPNANGTGGRINLFYGFAVTNPTTVPYTTGIVSNISNPITLASPPTTSPISGSALNNTVINGGSAGDRAGFSLSYGANPLTSSGSTTQSSILIGCPAGMAGRDRFISSSLRPVSSLRQHSPSPRP